MINDDDSNKQIVHQSARRYPDMDPITAFAQLLLRNVFGLFDQAPVHDKTLMERVKGELTAL